MLSSRLDRLELPVLVIGAGPAGLAAMRALDERKIPYHGVERHSEVGGMWNQSNPQSAAYDGLETVASKGTMSLGDPFPKSEPHYLPRQRAHNYLQQYAQRHQLLNKIQFGTQVLAVIPNLDKTFTVRLENPQQPVYQKNYRAVVVASGFHNRENISFPQAIWEEAEKNGIPCRHSADYRNPTSYRNKQVLVVGVGNSGAEIAKEIAEVAEQTWLAVRTAPWLVPMWVMGIPTDIFAQGHFLPHRWELAFYRWLQRRLVGHPHFDIGFQPLNHDLMERLPVGDRGIVAAIKSGRVILRPNIKKIEAGQVFFESTESPIQVDEILFATGYRRHYSFLPPEYQDLDKTKLAYLLFAEKNPGIIFMTETVVPQGAWPIFWEQAQTLADYFALENKDAERAQQVVQRGLSGAQEFKGKIFKRADRFHVDPKVYLKALKTARQSLQADEG